MSFFRGGPGDDFFGGTAGADSIFGRDGNDDLFGGSGDDLLDGGLGDDRLGGDDGLNVLRGRQGDDSLVANGTAFDSLNILLGDRGDDFLGSIGSGYSRMEGGTGNDFIQTSCERGAVNQSTDALTGRGFDTVSFDTSDTEQFSQCHVRDFEPGLDHIQLSAQRAPEAGGGVFGTAALFALMDTDGNGVLDGNDPRGDFAFAFKLGEPEHGIGMFVQGDALVIELPPGHDALAASDFLLA